ncbi:anthranilate/aminodeoxychorismate synthase component II [Candidatus Woesearchaeota archaeon]|nr:anthranilate/aminodeoxychorismate synthase component II [Candidatus Woesearchaeota archaeon]
MKIFVIDNFGLSTYNLVDELEKREHEVVVYGNDIDPKIVNNFISKFKPDFIIIASGTGNPSDSGNSKEIINAYYGKIPVLGLGLGMQCIVELFEGKVERSPAIMHAKTSKIIHDNKSIFKKLDEFTAARYNSLAATEIPYSFEVSARDENDVVMGIRHKDCFLEGIMFHPESILSPTGKEFLDNVLERVSKK